MDKISGIIKSSPRVQSVDIRESSPIRPGTPLFGRPEGISSLNKPVNTLETGVKASAVAETLGGWKAKDQKSAAMAADLTNKFFAKPTPIEDEASMHPGLSAAPSISTMAVLNDRMSERESKPAGFKSEGPMSFRAASSRLPMPTFSAVEEESTISQPEGLYPKGSFIDRTA